MQAPILLISYLFPPYPGVGGRRWAKFAKYLSRDGIDVHVICARNPLKEHSSWTADVTDNPHIIAHPLPAMFPRLLLRTPRGRWNRAIHRFTGTLLGLSTPGTMYDHAVLWKSGLLHEARRLLNQYEIKTVIATGAPFHVLHHALSLKDSHPRIKLISDFRDPWTDEPRYIANLSARRYRHEQKLEQEVLDRSDIVTTPSTHMTKILKARSKSSEGNFVTLHNGFDSEDMNQVSSERKRSDGKIRFIHAGPLNVEIEDIITQFFYAVAELREKSKKLYERLEFLFFGPFSEKYVHLMKTLGLDVIKQQAYAPLETVLRETARSDYGLLFMRDSPAYSYVVKFVEYLGARKKIIFVAAANDFMNEIEESRIGFGCRLNSMATDLEKICKSYDSQGPQFPESFDREKFSLPKLTSQLKALLE